MQWLRADGQRMLQCARPANARRRARRTNRARMAVLTCTKRKAAAGVVFCGSIVGAIACLHGPPPSELLPDPIPPAEAAVPKAVETDSVEQLAKDDPVALLE